MKLRERVESETRFPQFLAEMAYMPATPPNLGFSQLPQT